jgi:hypothetical protein
MRVLRCAICEPEFSAVYAIIGREQRLTIAEGRELARKAAVSAGVYIGHQVGAFRRAVAHPEFAPAAVVKEREQCPTIAKLKKPTWKIAV